jgi:hypothetical protein
LHSNLKIDCISSDEDEPPAINQIVTTFIREPVQIKKLEQKNIEEDDNFKETYLILVVHGIWCAKEF